MKVEIESPTSAGVYIPYIRFTAETIPDGFSLGLMHSKLRTEDIKFASLVNSDEQNHISVAAHSIITHLMGGFTSENQTLKYESVKKERKT